MSDLTTAIKQKDPRAVDIAADLGKAAIPDIERLMQSEDSTVRMITVRALERMELEASYPILWDAMADEDINVAHETVSVLEKKQAELSSRQLFAFLERGAQPEVTVRIILLLGDRLRPAEADRLQAYCSVKREHAITLHCMAALAKIGLEDDRNRFAQHLSSLQGNITELRAAFALMEYISQPWLAPSLRILLANETPVEFLGDAAALFGLPSYLRVCDQAVLLAARILDLELSFNTAKAGHFTEQQRAEVSRAIGRS